MLSSYLSRPSRESGDVLVTWDLSGIATGRRSVLNPGP